MSTVVAALACLNGGALAACKGDPEPDADKTTGEEVEEAADDVGDDIEEAADDAEDEVDEAM